MHTTRWLAAVAVLSVAPVALAEEPAPVDGPSVPFKDDFVDKLVGQWVLSGNVMGKAARQALEVQWVLNHQFLQLHFKGEADPAKKEPPYEALVYWGYDNLGERHVIHWIDSFGGRYSETLGYGTRTQDAVKFAFDGADGPFHTTFSLAGGKFTILMRQKDKAGKWMTFAEFSAAKAKK